MHASECSGSPIRLRKAEIRGTSICCQDAHVVKLLQAHADVVAAFIANGRSEMMKNHPLPPREQP